MRAVVLLVALAAVVPSAAVSQTVLADIHIGSGPVQGRIVIGPTYHYAAPVVVSRYHAHPPVVIHQRSYGNSRSYHRVYLWYHPATRRYYDHPYPGLHGLHRVSVREHKGRHWRDD